MTDAFLELRDILKRTSRSFYLSIAVLPQPVRMPISVAYLLARAADTIADTELIAVDQRESLLLALRQSISSGDYSTLEPLKGDIATNGFSTAEADLLRALPSVVNSLDAFTTNDRELVCGVVSTLIDGMLFDLAKFKGASASRPACLANEEEVERYTYLVAGCVGEFWTRLLVQHTPGLGHWDVSELTRRGVEFGKALQLTNVLRDMNEDVAKGRIYIAHNEAETQKWLSVAVRYFDSARIYVNAIPRRYVRLRLSAFWPAVFGLYTLDALSATRQWYARTQRVKVSRAQIYRIMLKSLLTVFSRRWTDAWLQNLASRVRARIDH